MMHQFLYFFLIRLFECVIINDFIRYGTENGDQELDLKKGVIVNNENFKLKFNKEYYKKIAIDINQIVVFNNDIQIETRNPRIVQNWCTKMILDKFGHVYHRRIDNVEQLNLISNEIRSSFDSKFAANWAYVVTWDHVCHSLNKIEDVKFGETNLRNTYQVILATDGSSSYFIFNFEKLDLVENYAVVGINYGSGFLSLIKLTSNVTNADLYKFSNCGNPGRWIYKVDSNEILSPNLTNIQRNVEKSSKSFNFIGSTKTSYTTDGTTSTGVKNPRNKTINDMKNDSKQIACVKTLYFILLNYFFVLI